MSTRTPIPVRGVTLLIAVILTSVVLSVALSLLDITYKQVLLSGSAKQSQFAFYNADTALECVLYWDQKIDKFDYTPASRPATPMTCNGQTITPSYDDAGAIHKVTLTLPCATGGATVLGQVTIYKYSAGGGSIFATGYNVCSAIDPRRIERGLKVSYGDSVATTGTVTYLLVGGGAGGGATSGSLNGGGGGAGGFIKGSVSLPSASYAVTIGTGGAGGNRPAKGDNGTDTTLGALLTAIGGGGGGAHFGQDGQNGGSGGGAGQSGGPGTGSQGGNGGTSAGAGAGGGGAGGNGSNAGLNTGGDGGAGLSSSISGVSVFYAGGGGGQGASTPGLGGTGGGANASTNATGNMGGGGGGGGGGGNGGSGANGTLIISFPTGTLGAVSATGGYVKTVVSGNDIYTFTSNGTFIVP